MENNPDPSKQGQEVIFSRKIQKSCYSSIYFHNKSVITSPFSKASGNDFRHQIKCPRIS